ncbi:MAG: hypothetical protein KAR31_06475, partial [Candidatus Omnitrophica bacterium]|nr:hypothetical protein [Candidatus Omnitrophota bacterium]
MKTGIQGRSGVKFSEIPQNFLIIMQALIIIGLIVGIIPGVIVAFPEISCKIFDFFFPWVKDELLEEELLEEEPAALESEKTKRYYYNPWSNFLQCAEGVFKDGVLDKEIEKEVRTVIRGSKKQKYEKLSKKVKGQIAGHPKLVEALSSKNVRIVRNKQALPVIWSKDDGYIFAVTCRGCQASKAVTYYPLDLIMLLIKAGKIDLLLKLFAFEKNNRDTGKEDIGESEALAEEIRQALKAGVVKKLGIDPIFNRVNWGLSLIKLVQTQAAKEYQWTAKDTMAVFDRTDAGYKVSDDGGLLREEDAIIKAVLEALFRDNQSNAPPKYKKMIIELKASLPDNRAALLIKSTTDPEVVRIQILRIFFQPAGQFDIFKNHTQQINFL